MCGDIYRPKPSIPVDTPKLEDEVKTKKNEEGKTQREVLRKQLEIRNLTNNINAISKLEKNPEDFFIELISLNLNDIKSFITENESSGIEGLQELKYIYIKLSGFTIQKVSDQLKITDAERFYKLYKEESNNSYIRQCILDTIIKKRGYIIEEAEDGTNGTTIVKNKAGQEIKNHGFLKEDLDTLLKMKLYVEKPLSENEINAQLNDAGIPDEQKEQARKAVKQIETGNASDDLFRKLFSADSRVPLTYYGIGVILILMGKWKIGLGLLTAQIWGGALAGIAKQFGVEVPNGDGKDKNEKTSSAPQSTATESEPDTPQQELLYSKDRELNASITSILLEMPASEHKTNIEKYLKENKDTPSKDITTSLGSSDNDTYTKRIVMAFELSTKVNEDEKLGVAKNYFKEILVNTKANEIKDESLKRKIELFVINNISNNENYKIASDTDPISYLFDTEDYNSLNDELKIIYGKLLDDIKTYLEDKYFVGVFNAYKGKIITKNLFDNYA